ncbi:MAG: 6-hydroxymethylpterin diphosphokinase MptE-like protein [Halobacteriales archaeon]
MDFATWKPVYEALLADFGYPRVEDERARDVLEGLVGSFDLDRLSVLASATVAVAGAGPSLHRETDRAADADAVVAASTAADVLADAGVGVDLLVTDLDKNARTARRLTRRGVPVAVHAHGDNVGLLERHVPAFDGASVLPTTQAAPAGPVRNFGGFTDGDRAAFLADHLGAAALEFPGWDFDDPGVGPEKARKLDWAERLLYWLERRRGDRFGVLDGRRDAIETAPLPVE